MKIKGQFQHESAFGDLKVHFSERNSWAMVDIWLTWTLKKYSSFVMTKLRNCPGRGAQNSLTFSTIILIVVLQFKTHTHISYILYLNIIYTPRWMHVDGINLNASCQDCESSAALKSVTLTMFEFGSKCCGPEHEWTTQGHARIWSWECQHYASEVNIPTVSWFNDMFEHSIIYMLMKQSI